MIATETDEQRVSTGERDEKGRFLPGNSEAWKRGQSGNPAGRSASVTEAIRRKLSEPGLAGGTVASNIADMLIALAQSGNVQALHELLDRAEGKARQAIDVDLKVTDWRTLAIESGIDETDVIHEARRLLESVDVGSDISGD